MKQKATVVAIDGKYATIKVDRASMCDGCHKSGCSDGCALYKVFGAKSEFVSVALNRAGAKTGDRVVVETPDSTVNISAFFVFLLPVLVAAAVYFATFFIEAEQYRILFAVASFAIYFVILAVIEKKRRTRAPKIVVTEISDGTSNS